MVLKIFSIVLFLSSLSSFATHTVFNSEEEADLKKISQGSQILNAVINTGKFPENVTDEERKFLEELSKEHCIDFTRTFKSLSYADVVKDKISQEIVRKNTILNSEYFPKDVHWKSVSEKNLNAEFLIHQDDNKLYEGYISMVFQLDLPSISGSSDNQKNSTSTKNDSVSKTVYPSEKGKKHVRKTSENLTFPEINSSKDNQISENLEIQGEIKADISVPKKNKKSSKSGFGMACFGKKSK